MLIFPGMITFSLFLDLNLPNPGLTQLALVLSMIEVAHKTYLNLPSPESQALKICARNHAKSVLQLAQNSFIHRKCQNLSRYNSP